MFNLNLSYILSIAYEKNERFDNQFEALDYIHKQALKINFDVQII